MARGIRQPSPRLEADLPGSSLEAEFGGTGGGVRPSPVAQATGSAVASSSTSPPPKAPSAPGKTNDVFTGLAEALNTFQRRLADPKNPNRKYDVPDEYEIEFTEGLGLGHNETSRHHRQEQGSDAKANTQAH
jgi:hypothetical protein